jgi:tetratricopeptide (TPR) repeat protein
MSDLQTMFVEAVEARKRGDARRSRALFEDLLRRFPECHEALYMHGMLNAELGDLPDAEARLRRALELDAGNPEYLFRLGSVLLARGRAEEAVEVLLQAEKEADESVALLTTLGGACVQAVRLPEAERAFRRALELEPGNAEAGMGLLSAILGGRRLDQAIDLARSLAAKHPGRADIQSRVAQALERANRVEEARVTSEAALALTPNDSVALGVRATLLKRAGRNEEAAAAYERAIAAAGAVQERRDLSRSLGLVLDEQGQHDEAYRCFLASKKPPAEISGSSEAFARDVERYMERCRSDLPAGATRGWPDVPSDGREDPVFFVGFPRSGTTLLEQMLAAHPRFVTSDEIQSLGRCTERIGVGAGGLEFAPGAYGGLTEGQVRALRGEYWSAIEEGLGGPIESGKRLIDKHPMNTVSLFTARRLFPRAKVIVSLRDPRDVVLSCFMHLSRTPMAVVYFRDLEQSSRLYAQIMGLWFHMRTALGLEWIEVKYEDVVGETERTARRVIEFLGESWDDAVLRHAEKAGQRAIRSTSYQQVSRGIYTKALGRWRAYERHFGKALEILRPYAEALGYGDG